MFKSNTVVIVGAGASAEAGLPVGSVLKDEISKLTKCKFEFGQLESGERKFIYRLVHSDHFGGDVERVAIACSKVSQGVGFVSSIDNFLEIHSEDKDVQFCAKCAIVSLISKGEMKSPQLEVDRSNIYNRLSSSALNGTWYQGLAQILYEKVSAKNLGSAFSAVNFISFNYDRCLEWFLYQSLMGLYALSSEDALRVLSEVEICHPYGQIGDENWTRDPGQIFGNEISGALEVVSAKIRTYTEGSLDQNIRKLRGLIDFAQNLVFLGFAFHPQNLQMLQPDVTRDYAKPKNIFFTCDGMSENDALEIETQLKHCFTRHNGGHTNSIVTRADLKCSVFMERYKRTLSA